jgi:RNA polymerase sigma-70 factor, ECF subfamily
MHIHGGHGDETDDAGHADEYSLVTRAQRGESAAFEQLYRLHVGRIYALCVRMTSDRDLAEELTQCSFVRIWEQLEKFKQKSSFATWSHRVSVNVVLEFLRSRARRPVHNAALDNLILGVDHTPSTSRRLDLEWAIGALPERARLVFVLYEIERFQHDEIAEMLGVAVGTSKAQLHRARQLLRETLK